MPDPVTQTELREMLDRQQLRRLVEDYAAHADTTNHEAWADLFVPDAVFEVAQAGGDGPVLHVEGRDELLGVLDHLKPFQLTQHFICNHRVELEGDQGSGEVYCLANHIRRIDADGELENEVQYLRYVDSYVRTEGGWRFARRDLVTRWRERGEIWTTPQALLSDPPIPDRPSERAWSAGLD